MLLSLAISSIFLSSTGLVLAALLVLAEKKILNYGVCRIDVNSGKRNLEVNGGSSLLSALSENGIFIPSACGGKGSCSYCKVKVIDGGGIIGPVEDPYLSPEDRKNNVRLSCQVKVKNDISISIPAELFSVKKYKGTLSRKKPLTHDILELRIDLAEPAFMEFTAGQYIQLESAEYKDRDPVIRAYSISSPPSAGTCIELIIRRIPEGICTTWVFDHLKEGETVSLSGPYGDFRLSDTNEPVIFIAGGSGMAPIWSMLRDMKEKGKTRKTTYFFGALTQNDLFYIREIEDLQKETNWLTYIPALSREPDDSGWNGERGLITDVVKKHFPDTSLHEAYLCGSPGMIDACLNVLKKGGMPENRIFFDKFA